MTNIKQIFFNVSQGIKNRLQKLTKRRPAAACNVTVATMACIYTGNEFTSPEGIMPEDHLMDILDSKEGRAYLQKIVPGATYNPWNDSYCIAWAVNKAVEHDICEVRKATIQEMLFHCIIGGAIGIGGGFIKRQGTSGHFVCVVGAATTQELSGMEVPDDIDINKVHSIIIDDPYGNFLNGYKDQNGNDLVVPVELFTRLTFGNSKTKTMQFYKRSIPNG